MSKQKKNGNDRRGQWKKNLEELMLPSCKLKFCAEQLRNLNFLFRNRLLHEEETIESEKTLTLARSVTERLVQRLVCGVGMLDKRFSSKYLIRSDHWDNKTKNTLEYYLRLDELSTPSLYATDNSPQYLIEEVGDFSKNHMKIRLLSSTFKRFADLTNSQGYLRRDKLQAKFVNLLAQIASSDSPESPSEVDESILCGSPGKIVDPYTLYRILQTASEEQVFFGPGGNTPRFPDPRDFRLAIVDEQDGIRMRIEFLSPTLSSISLNVKIILSICIDSWPSTTDFPFRIPLGHSDYLLYQRAAQTGFYLASCGVEPAAWQIRFPACFTTLLQNYSSNSTVISILRCLNNIMKDIQFEQDGRTQNQLHYNVLTTKILENALFLYLEKDFSSPSTTLINWSPRFLSTHVLKLANILINSLINQHHPHYLFTKVNILSNVGHLCEEDYLLEANKLQTYLVRLFDESLMSTRNNAEFKKLMSFEDLEMVLLYKWNDLVEGLLPPVATRGSRLCCNASNTKDAIYSQYTTRQLEYIGLLLKNMLFVKGKILKSNGKLNTTEENQQLTPLETVEDIVYILATILEQARDQYLETLPKAHDGLKIKSKIKNQFDQSTRKVIDLIRKEKDLPRLHIQDDDVLVRIILKWLYKCMDNNKKLLAPVLRPYLNNLFNSSYIISWHINTIKEDSKLEEIESLGIFCKLVNGSNISPAHGLVDAVKKNWNWANGIVQMLENNHLRVVFTPERGTVFRHILSLPQSQNKKQNNDKINMNKIEKVRSLSLPSQKFFNTLLKTNEIVKRDFNNRPQHCILKEHSSLTLLALSFHRQGEHRCAGDVIKSLLDMQKLNITQDISPFLSGDEKLELLETIQKIHNEKVQKKLSKKWSNTLPHTKKANVPLGDIQRYTKKEESAGIPMNTVQMEWNKSNLLKNGTLIGSCRAARLRDDQISIFEFQQNFVKRSALKSKDSFKN